jgi:class 3 adenylate cyclase/tetratricopeptide (TPR) repeat protein
MVVCPVCGESNPERARFCLNCAAPLTPEPMAEVEERKVVTVLFCDLVGFTARAERSDPEDVRHLLDSYHARLRREIERFGGTIEKFIGDAVMAVFGAPVSHEDDAERGVRAALRILDAVAELNEERPGLDLAVRIGVNSGEAVVAIGGRADRGQGIVAGDVVNTASRLQAIAPEGGVVVGELTCRATRDVIEYRELEPVSLKGKAEPVSIWQALAARSRYGVDVDQRASTPFLGRSAELALLRAAFQRTVDESAVQLVTVTGEPGAGKSRLLWEFRTILDDDPSIVVSWRQGRCLPYGEGITYWALGEMVKGQTGILETDGPDEASAKLTVAVEAVIGDPLQLEWIKARLAGLVGVASEPADRSESFAAWRTFLEAVTTRGPLILVFEDLHWADEALVAFVDHLVDWATEVPIFVVCTARPELYERHPGWAGGKRNATNVALSRLSDEDTARLVFALLAQVALPAEVQQVLLERAGGNPLFAEEYVRMLLDRGILERRGRTVSMAQDADIPLPETIQASIAARLDTLSPARKALLHDAAVIGKVFWPGALAEMGPVDEAAVTDGLHELARKELVRRARSSSVGGQAEYAFWHALVRDVAYGQIPRAARSGKHQAAAEWIRRIAGERVSDVAELLAYHYDQALSLAVTAGLDDRVPGLRAQAFGAFEMAGERAMSLDSRKAYEFYRRALELSIPESAQHGRLLIGVVTSGSGNFGGSGQLDPAQGKAMLEEAVEAFRAAGESLALGRALTLQSRHLWFDGDPEASRTPLSEAIAVLETHPASRELAEAYAEMAGRDMLAGRMVSGRGWADKALALADSTGAKDVYARALQFRGTFRIALDGDEGGLQDLRDALTLALETGELAVIEPGYDNLADFLHDVEGPEAGYAMYREGIEFLHRRGGAALWERGESTWPLYALGRWDEVLRVADEVLEADRQAGMTQLTGLVAPEKARILTYRGRPEEARALMDPFLPRAREIRDPQILVRSLVAGAVAALGCGDRAGALALMNELVTMPSPWDIRYWALPEGARVLVEAGEPEIARRLLDGDGTEPIMPNVRVGGQYSRAVLLEAEGRHGDALALYRAAAAWYDGRASVYHEARALVGAGRCELALSRTAEAAADLQAAAETFDRMGARALSAEVAHLTETAAGRGRARSG